MNRYPSIDRPQEKYYRNKPIREICLEQTIYEMVFNTNKNNLSAPAIRYMGKEWSFGELKERVDVVAGAFQMAGVGIGDIVLIGLPNCPEAVICLLAINKIGGVSQWVDIRIAENDLEKYLRENNCKYIVVLDSILTKVKNIEDKIELNKVLIVCHTDSLSENMPEINSEEDLKLSKVHEVKYQKFAEFLTADIDYISTSPVPFDKSRKSIMVQSSGTTGKPKIIVHSDFSATSAVKKLAYSDLPLGEGRVLLTLLPPWIAYTLGEAILYPLALGTEVILCPTFEPSAIMAYLGEFTICMAAPFFYRYLAEHINDIEEKKRIAFWGKTECLVSGGDKITIEENANFEKIFQTPVINGWGSNEGWGCLAVNSVKHNQYGSVGIPKYKETVIAWDDATKKELPYNEVGEICVLTDTLFLGYKNNDEETQNVKRLHEDGKIWLHTGDLGYINEEGYIFLAGRMRRVIVRQAFKISAYTIEDKICEHPLVKECVAVEVDDLREEHVPMAFIVLKHWKIDEDEIRNEIYEKCCNELKEYEVPKYLIFIKELPYTQNSKYDFRLLEQMGNEYVKMIQKHSLGEHI